MKMDEGKKSVFLPANLLCFSFAAKFCNTYDTKRVELFFEGNFFTMHPYFSRLLGSHSNHVNNRKL